MGIEMGRISGPLLSDNLIRNGVDLAVETDLLYFDVISGKVGINTDSPATLLNISGTTQTTSLIADTQTDIDSFIFVGNKIQHITDNIYIRPNQTSNPVVVLPPLQSQNLLIGPNLIENTTLNNNIIISCHPSGKVKFDTTLVDVVGNIHSTGNITWDGTITFGSDAIDSIDFNAGIGSDLIPDLPAFYELGKNYATVGKLYSTNVKSFNITSTNSIIVNDFDLLLTQGNTIYVSKNGDDNNQGTHLQATFKTIKHALLTAQNGDEIVIFPGAFAEDFPLIVPQGVSVRGMSTNSVIITPTPSTNTNDAFLLHGDTSVSFVTIKDFFINNITNTGYAFKFAPDITVNSQSPYIFNINVNTSGTVTSPNDPLGFAHGDAGGGVYIDGALINPISPIFPPVLIYSSTFITPNQDAIVATNGAKLECSNVATYYAKRGLYLKSGINGVSNSGLTASVVTNGTPGESWAAPVTLIYAGKLNGKNSYYQGDNRINWTGSEWRFYNITVGTDVYYSSFDNVEYPWLATSWIATGALLPVPSFTSNISPKKFGAEVRITNSKNAYGTYGSVADGFGTLANLTGHTFAYIGNNGDSRSWIDSSNHDNELVVINGGVINHESMQQRGTYRVGDIITIDQDNKHITLTANNINFVDKSEVTIASENGLANINSSGIRTDNILIQSNDINSLYGTVKFKSAANKINLNNDVNVAGSMNITGNTVVKGNVFLGDSSFDTLSIFPLIDQTLSPDDNALIYSLGLEDKRWRDAYLTMLNVDGVITIENNTITSTTDLILNAAGTGIISIDSTDVIISNLMLVSGFSALHNIALLNEFQHSGISIHTGDITRTGNTNITGNLSVTALVNFADIKFDNNVLTTTLLTNDLTLLADGSGIVSIPTNDVLVDNNLTAGHAYLNSAVVLTTTTATELFDNDISIYNNVITTTISSNDLILKAHGTGRIYVPLKNVEITNDLTISGTSTFGAVNIGTALLPKVVTQQGDIIQTGDITRTGNTNITGNLSVTTLVNFADIKVDNNVLTTTLLTNDLTLLADGSGIVSIPTNDVLVDNNLTAGHAYLNSAVVLTTTTATELFDNDISIYNNVITTTISSNDLILKAHGTGRIYVPLKNVEITNDLTVDGTITVQGNTTLENTEIYGVATVIGNTTQTGNFNLTGILANTDGSNITLTNPTSITQAGDVKLTTNIISSTGINQNIQFSASGAGGVVLDNKLKITDTTISNRWDLATTESQKSIIFSPTGTSNVTIDASTYLTIPVGNVTTRVFSDVGEIRFNSLTNLYDGAIPSGILRFNNLYDSDMNSYITAELTSGLNDNTVRFGINGNVTTTITEQNLTTNTIEVDNIQLTKDTITNIGTNANLLISPNGSGATLINGTQVNSNKITNTTNNSLTLRTTGMGYVRFNGSKGIVVPYGDSSSRRQHPEIGETRYNTQLRYLEIFNGTLWDSVSGTQGFAPAEVVEDIMNTWSIILG